MDLERRGLGSLLTLGFGSAVLGRAMTSSVRAAPTPDQVNLVRRANVVLDDARHDTEFPNSRQLFQAVRGMMVVPELVKGGFFAGGEGGNGVLMVRQAGHWSNPAFYTLASPSFGLQIGLEVAEVVLLVMSERALNAWMQDEVKPGGEAGLNVLVLGANPSAAATVPANVDVIAWAKTQGFYAGLTLDGSLIKPRNEWNAAYYGRPVSPEQVLKMPA